MVGWLAVEPHGSPRYWQLRSTFGFSHHFIHLFWVAYRREVRRGTIPAYVPGHGVGGDSCSNAWCSERYGVECVGFTSADGYGCTGAWTNAGIEYIHTEEASAKRIDLVPCGAALVLSIPGGPDAWLVGGGGGCFFDIYWQMHGGGLANGGYTLGDRMTA